MTVTHILRRLPAAACALAMAACAPCPFPPTQPAGPVATEWVEATVRVIPVQIQTLDNGASGQFAPREVHARRGDLLRFTMTHSTAFHNVSFTAPRGDGPGVPLPADSPMLHQTGQSWQVRVDLPPGTYEFACIVHMPLGMRGTLIVEP